MPSFSPSCSLLLTDCSGPEWPQYGIHGGHAGLGSRGRFYRLCPNGPLLQVSGGTQKPLPLPQVSRVFLLRFSVMSSRRPLSVPLALCIFDPSRSSSSFFRLLWVIVWFVALLERRRPSSLLHARLISSSPYHPLAPSVC